MKETQTPLEAAKALASIPVFEALTPVDRAKLAGVLEERWLDPGTVVFEAGAEGDALYILREGTAERRVAGAVIDLIRPLAVFGELSLLTDARRSSSVVAVTPLHLWVLPRQRFHSLLRGEPELMLDLMGAMGLELARTRQTLGALRWELHGWVGQRLAARTPEDRLLIEAAAFFERPPARILARVASLDDAGTGERLQALARGTPLLHEDDDGIHIPAAVRNAVRHNVALQGREREVAARIRTAAEALEREGHLEDAAHGYLAAGAPVEARRVLESMPDADPELLARTAAADPAAPRTGMGEGAAPATPVATRPVVSRFRGVARFAWIAVALLPLALWNVTPPAGLEPAGWRALLTLVSAAVLFASEALPETAVALGLLVSWGATGIVPPRVALEGFATETWLLVLTVLAVGAAVGNTGLLYRAALAALGRRPRGFAHRCLTLALVGTAVTPTLPNATARVALAAPMVREIAEALGYRPGDRAAAGLALAALIGFGQMSALFLTGASVGLLVHGLLPPEVRDQFGFAGWLLAALPLHLVLFALAMLAVIIIYRPRSAPPQSGDRLALQRAVLGPMRREERLCAWVLSLLIAGFLTEPLHGVSGAWLGVAAFIALSAGGVLDANMIRSGVNWPFLVFLGVITSMAGVFRTLGIDAWLAQGLAEPVRALGGSSMLLCLALAVAGFALSFVVRWQAAAPLLTLVALPVGVASGVNPFLVGLIALVSTQVWFLPYQSTVYLALHHGTADLFAHRDVRRIAWLWGPMVLLSVAAAVPVWRAMGYAG